MRYELDADGYLAKVFFGCLSGKCTEYTGEIPSGYNNLEQWARSVNIRTYKIVNGNLTYDSNRATALQQQLLNETHKILWSGTYFMKETQEITLSESISKQPSGIVLAWSGYENGAAGNFNLNYTFIPKQHVLHASGSGVACHMSGTKFGNMACKYVYVSNNHIKGHTSNDEVGTTNGVPYANNTFVLRYVYGV